MLIGGWQKFTMVDYPEHLATIVFTNGCNFKCRFCYNSMLVASANKNGAEESCSTDIPESDFFLFLKDRLGKIEGVVITGGEPTIQSDLPKFIEKIKALNYKIKLDTNGTNPEMLKKLLDENLLDYIAMDLKAPEDKYELITGVKINFDKIKESIKIIISSGLPHEFRTTMVPGLLDREDIIKMGELIKSADKWFLQKFKSDIKLIDPSLENKAAYLDKEMDRFAEAGGEFVKYCSSR